MNVTLRTTGIELLETRSEASGAIRPESLLITAGMRSPLGRHDIQSEVLPVDAQEVSGDTETVASAMLAMRLCRALVEWAGALIGGDASEIRPGVIGDATATGKCPAGRDLASAGARR